MHRIRHILVACIAACILITPVTAHADCGDVNQEGGLDVLDLILLVHAIINETVDELQCAGNLDSDCPPGALIGVDAAGKWACGNAADLGVVGAQGPPGQDGAEGPQGPPGEAASTPILPNCPVGSLLKSAGNGTWQCSLPCAWGSGDCNQDPADGCETNIATDGDHCGGCGIACTADAPECADGACGAIPIGGCKPGDVCSQFWKVEMDSVTLQHAPRCGEVRFKDLNDNPITPTSSSGQELVENNCNDNGWIWGASSYYIADFGTAVAVGSVEFYTTCGVPGCSRGASMRTYHSSDGSSWSEMPHNSPWNFLTDGSLGCGWYNSGDLQYGAAGPYGPNTP